ncbi:MAG: hypothetical protein QOJ29_1742, partial [Thermoleophilaceae bacterium]|nr:hypothetical protein [Thermoleophilaceae bacterium]
MRTTGTAAPMRATVARRSVSDRGTQDRYVATLAADLEKSRWFSNIPAFSDGHLGRIAG